MKSLLLDVGNTRLKWALCEGGQLSQQGALRYEMSSFEAQLAASLGKLVVEVGPLAGVTMSNVAGKKRAAVVQKSVGMTIKSIFAQSAAYGVRCAYENPMHLGTDRWAALVAARHKCTGASCIIDCGTTLTVDVLTADGQHAGGIIVPGLEIMKSSLLENTDGVLVGEREDLSVLSVTNTEDAVQAGILAALRGAVQQVLQQCQDELGEMPTCVLTGGNAKWLRSGLPDTTKLEPDWVLKGLAIIDAAED